MSHIHVILGYKLSNPCTSPSSGSVTDEYTLPSTVTTWVIQAVTMSDTEGMCVAPPVEQVVRKDLFVKLHLPHTAVQGEQIELAATVYNLDPDDVRVSLFSECC